MEAAVLMIIETRKTRTYYPVPNRRMTAVRGSGRIRYVRGNLSLMAKAH
jgi:hypothetical protein